MLAAAAAANFETENLAVPAAPAEEALLSAIADDAQSRRTADRGAVRAEAAHIIEGARSKRNMRRERGKDCGSRRTPDVMAGMAS
mmetsp:Transcript_51685/g.102904  ORF Transcript_51685/g.102904 Transcript_51685/m.102904 type:complete len:85 (-) Transcript_51685:21-275(-)